MGEGTKTLPRKERVIATVDSKRAEEESCQQRCTHDPDDSDKADRPPLKTDSTQRGCRAQGRAGGWEESRSRQLRGCLVQGGEKWTWHMASSTKVPRQGSLKYGCCSCALGSATCHTDMPPLPGRPPYHPQRKCHLGA